MFEEQLERDYEEGKEREKVEVRWPKKWLKKLAARVSEYQKNK